MIPLRDNISSRTFPVVNYALIAANLVCFLYQLSLGQHMDRFVLAWGMVPANVVGYHGHGPLATFTPVITAMFLHGGWLHVLGNMLYLYIFGDNVEDRMGHGRYLVFYLLCGICAAATQLWSAPAARIPMVGASGAIAGVMGAYFCLYPRARIVTLIFLFIIIDFVEVPAFFFLAFWFLLQFINGAVSSSSQGGVAWWAHIGGFAGGIALLFFFKKPRRSLL
jgi:membrane associated rhomboid family serine protease